MSKKKIIIKFINIHKLWQFAQKIGAVNIEINTQDKILICDCTEDDINLLHLYEGTVIGEYHPSRSFREQY